MDFGKLSDMSRVDFSLLPDPPQNAEVLGAAPKTSAPPRLYVGPTGYNMRPWVGSWYPAGAKDKDYLRHYGAQFNTIEHNTTHYRIPDAATVARWREETPDDFRFCPKIPQVISHARDLGLNGQELGAFCRVIGGLEDKLGCCFLQLPPTFSTRDLPVLERFVEIFSPHIPLAVEVRHESFFSPAVEAEYFFQLLQREGVTAVITDVAGRRDVCHMRLTGVRTMVRFVGYNLHASDYTRVQAWAQRLQGWLEMGLREVYFFTHEPDNLLAPDLAAYVTEVFSGRMPHAVLRGPKKVTVLQGSLF